MNKPKFKHCCNKCKFLGTLNINDRYGEVYVCSREITEIDRFDDILVRFSDEDSDYLCTHPATFSPLDPFSAAAVAMWVEHHNLNGWNHERGLLFKDSELVVRLWQNQTPTERTNART